MKSNRLFAAAVLIGAISFALPLYASSDDNSIEGPATPMYEGAQDNLKDAGITSRIRAALAINPITKSAAIHIDTDEGIVNLTGDVPNVSVIQEAQEIAQSTEHVKGVRNRLEVERVSNASWQF